MRKAVITGTIFLTAILSIESFCLALPHSPATVGGPADMFVISPPRTEIVSDKDKITIPLKNSGRLFMVEAVIDGQSGHLIFDTGTSGIVMNKTYFRNYVPWNNIVSNGISGPVSESLITLDSLKIPGLAMRHFSASLADLSHIENQRGIKVLGLFGFSMIKDFEIIIDLSRKVMHLYRIDKNGNRLAGDSDPFAADYIQRFETSYNILFVTATVAGKDLKFCLDTGAETNVINSHAGKTVLKTIIITGSSELRGVGPAKPNVIVGNMSDFCFGNREITNMSTIVTNMDALCKAYGTMVDGMLGYDFLKNGVFCVNFVKQQISVIYNRKK